MIYMDHAATTPLSREVLEAMLPWLKEGFGNASALYPLGLKSAAAIDRAREHCAAVIVAEPAEIYFTSGGSESDNWALVKTAEKYAREGGHLITTAMEHHAILNTCRYLESRGYDVTVLRPGPDGQIRPEQVEDAVRSDTFLVSVMTANNEIGAVQPIREIGSVYRKKKILFHTDAVQAFGHIPINVKEDCIDLLSASGHKFNGPKGTGFLYMRKGLRLPPLIAGGQQERGSGRSGGKSQEECKEKSRPGDGREPRRICEKAQHKKEQHLHQSRETVKEPDALGFVGNRLIPDQNSCDIHGKITISGETTGQGVGEHAEPEQKCLGENHIFQMQKPQQTYGDKGHDCPDGDPHRNLQKQHLRDSSGGEVLPLHQA